MLVLLMSRYALDCKQYHHEKADITWGCSDLRKWLNDEFLRSAFSDEEQKRIAVTNLKNAKNPHFRTPGGNNTKDSVFCLDLSQARTLLRTMKIADVFPRHMQRAKESANLLWIAKVIAGGGCVRLAIFRMTP